MKKWWDYGNVCFDGAFVFGMLKIVQQEKELEVENGNLAKQLWDKNKFFPENIERYGREQKIHKSFK